jgi:hypothetical protein
MLYSNSAAKNTGTDRLARLRIQARSPEFADCLL